MSQGLQGKNEFGVGELADWLEVRNTTIHNWSDTYAEYMSEGANPPKGEERIYILNDTHILWTIKALRDMKVSHDAIAMRLESGLRIEPDHLPYEAESKPTPATPEGILRKMQAKIEEYETTIKELEAKNNRLEGENNSLVQQLESQRSQLFELVLKITRGDKS